MRKETKIEKLQAKFIRDMVELKGADNITQAYSACRMSQHEVGRILKKRDPELYVKLNSWINEDLAFNNFTYEQLLALPYDQYHRSVKFKKFLELIASGVRKNSELQKLVPCGKTYTLYYKRCLKRAIRKELSKNE